MNHLRTAGSAAYAASQVAVAEPPVSAVPANRPVARTPVQPAPPVVPAQPTAQPAAPVAPTAPPRVDAPVPRQDGSVAIFVHLTSGERVWAGRFDSGELAERRANEIVHALNRPEPGVWAKFGNRLIRPEAVVSIEIASRRED